MPDETTETITPPDAATKPDGKQRAANILFIVSLAIYAIVTVTFAVAVGSALGSSDDTGLGAALVIIMLLVGGSCGYGVCVILNVVALVLANVKRGARKFWGVRCIIAVVAAIATEILFVLLLMFA